MKNPLSIAPGQAIKANRLALPTAIALAGFWYFAFVVLLLHGLRPDSNPLNHFVSEYAVGPYGWLMTSAFFGLSLGSVALLLALYRGISREGRSWVGLLLLAVWCVGTFLAGMYKTDLYPGPETAAGKTHSLVSLIAFVSLILSALFLLRFRKDAAWRPYYRTYLIMGITLLLSFKAFFLTILVGNDVVGLLQRIFLAMVLTWLIGTALRLRSLQ